MTVASPPITILLIGDRKRAEFRDARRIVEAERASFFPTLAEAAQHTAPDVCILLQSTAGEFGVTDLEAALRRWPLTRFITIAGSLGEGEPRTGAPWGGQSRIYWHAFPGWWRLQQARVARGHAPEWALPRTSGEEHALLQLPTVTWPELTGPIGIASARRSAAQALLLDALRATGLSGVWLPNDERIEVVGLQAIVWDDDDPDGHWRADLLQLRQRWPGVPLLALRNFPRVDDRDWLEERFERTAVMAKPYDLEVLLATLASMVASANLT